MTSSPRGAPTPGSGAPPSGAADGGPGRYAGDRLMRVGAWTTAAGMVLTLVAIVPLVVPSVHLPSAFWWLAMVTGVGLTLMLLGFWRAARTRSRRVADALGRPSE